ncbi:variant erythrocyte surface antigen-1 family protein [Babesia caballi]|uniref:Variant erythrocyte surface antigen-1 family protein n=1 Tax=Babesia caballi TaxID=5871 RepID=A0AAV4LUQ3_BABCB|nr:variant erythrocyte surface antigen-1 family protein [Babesia caballi]
MSTPGQKSLTEPPENLKEAIDWVLRVSGLASGPIIYMHYFIDALEAFVRNSPIGSTAFLENLCVEIKKDEGQKPTGPFKQLAESLQRFIGYGHKRGGSVGWGITGEGIVKMGEMKTVYTPAYDGSWFTDVYSNDPNDVKKKSCVQNFFTAIEKIYEGLTELYWKCKKEWKNDNLGGNTELNQFMKKNGFTKTQLNTSMTGDKIANNALRDLKEFTTAYNDAGDNPSLEAFRSQLEQNASTDPSKSPLSALYILSTYAYVHSSSPATSSFAGYSGLTALAGGAYGFNLGGLGTVMSALLA